MQEQLHIAERNYQRQISQLQSEIDKLCAHHETDLEAKQQEITRLKENLEQCGSVNRDLKEKALSDENIDIYEARITQL